MPAYFGRNQLFRNRNGTGALREIYFGNQMIMGFNSANYSADEIVKEKAPAGDYPEVNGNGSTITISTVNYNPGYGFSKYYCDHVKLQFTYSGTFLVFDCEGNTKVEITQTISFSFASANWTMGSKCVINGNVVFDSSHTARDVVGSKLTYEVYFDLSSRRWCVIWDGGTYYGNVEEWKPTYFRAMPQMWFIISQYDQIFVNGVIGLTNMNRARGYPNAK